MAERFLLALIPACLAALAFLLALPLLRRVCSARSLYLASLVLLVGLLIPIRPQVIPVRLPAGQRTAFTTAAPPAMHAEQSAAQRALPAAPPQSAPAASAPAPAQPPRITARQGLFMAWAVGAIATAALQLLRHRRFRQVVRRWQRPVADPLVLRQFEDTRRCMGIRRDIALAQCAAVRSPMLTGLFRPVILLPDDRLSPAELRFVFRHELTHWQRHDLWAKVLQAAALCLHWWNPMARLLSRAAQELCEAACDEAVLQGEAFSTRQFYSETILSVIRPGKQAASPVTTAFYGGKKGMKKRIESILDPRVKRFGAALTALALLVTALGGLAAPDTPASAYSNTAYLFSPSGTVNLCMIPTDYDYPQSVYFNGTQVEVMEVIDKESQYGTDTWAKVAVRVNDSETVISGYTPAIYLRAREDLKEIPPQPLADLAGEGDVTIWRDNGLTEKTLGTLPGGTRVRVLGFTKTHYHVLAEGRHGFVLKEQLLGTKGNKRWLRSAEPNHYTNVGPGYEDRYRAMTEEYQALTDKRGDINSWTLAQRAAWTQREIDEGFLDDDPMTWINLMPAAGDVQEAEARAIADKALADRDVPLDSFGQVFTFYYATVAQPDAPTWQFSYQGLTGQHTYIVFLDKAGSVTEVRKADITPEGSGYYDKISWYMYESAPAQPREGDIAREQAIDSAWQAFEAAYAPANGNRDSYKAAATLRSLDSTRFWVVLLYDAKKDDSAMDIDTYTDLVYPGFYVAVGAAGGEALAHTDIDWYKEAVEDDERLDRLQALEKERGPFFTWTLEQKAELYPEYNTLPGEGHLTREEALAIAVKNMAEQHGIEDIAAAGLTPYFFFLPDPPRWQIHMLTEAALTDSNLSGYYIELDATTGEILFSYSPDETNG